MALTGKRAAPAALPAMRPAVADPAVPTPQPTRRPMSWLLVVAAAYVTAILVVVTPRVALSWDETLYASQVSPRTPPGFFSAPRARGVTYLIAPVVQLTASTVALRTYLALLAGVLLVVGFWPWLRVFRRPAAVPLAALVFSSLWMVLFYGPSAMPNSWVALGALATVGWFVRYGYGARAYSLLGVGAGLAFVTLMRPSDAFWVCLPLAVAMLVRRWRRLPLYGTALAGVAVGLAPWIIESYQRFGGPLARLHRASQVEGGFAWHPIGAHYEMSTLDGPLLCRPCQGHLVSPMLALWWLAIPVLVLLGLVVAARARELPVALVPAACGTSVGLSYLLTLAYAAPRFLIPAYALLSLPVGGLLAWIVGSGRPRARVAAGLVVGLVLAAQVASQLAILVHEADRHTAAALGYPSAAVALQRYGIHRPCIINGKDDVPIGYAAGCREEEWRGHNRTTTRAGLLSMAHHEHAVYVSHRTKPPAFLHGWRRHPLPTPRGEHRWFAYTPGWQAVR